MTAGPPERKPRVRLPHDRRAGPHLPIGHGLLKAADRAAGIGAWTLQIFSDNPTAWRRRSEAPAEAAAFKARMAELDLGPLSIHASYLINLAGSDQALYERSVEVLRQELLAAPAFGARFVNVHAGSHRGGGVEVGIARLVDGLSAALGDVAAGREAPLVVVENSSGGGDAIGVTIEQLASIDLLLRDRGLGSRTGFCLDTAHLWGAGYDISRPDEIDRLLDEFDREIGLERLAMIHLNDTTSSLGSRHDRHIHLGDGRIGEAGLGHFIRHEALRRAAFYFETPGMEHGFDALNLARIADLAESRPLTSPEELGLTATPAASSRTPARP